MYHTAEQRLKQLSALANKAVLKQNQIGLEKESLRVNVLGGIAQTPHPDALGSALTHPYITTDYSEALLELVTPPFTELPDLRQFLTDLHRYVYSKLENELLWATSMPCVVAGETSIPIAKYGTSNLGMMKTVYRRGLGHRYGRVMQVIAGVHFNFSFADGFWPEYREIVQSSDPDRQFIDAAYFGLLRNLLRLGWFIPYLFGASPAVCKSFLQGKQTTLQEFNQSTYYEPFATSLRMGDIGYQNNKETEIGVVANYSSLPEYVESLTAAINTPYAGYQKIGVEVDGRFEQLNANILQIENEYYSTVRPKQIISKLEKPSLALMRRGVRYIELRSLDVNAYHPLGISEQQLYFLQALMLFCLCQDSPPITEQEREEIDRNEMLTAHQGRDPALRLTRGGKPISIRQWGGEVLDQMQGFCELLDAVYQTSAYGEALAAQRQAVDDPDCTPSARMLAEMRANNEGFFQYAMRMSLAHQKSFMQQTISQQKYQEFEQLAKSSREEQARIEAEEQLPFATFLQHYFTQS